MAVVVADLPVDELLSEKQIIDAWRAGAVFNFLNYFSLKPYGLYFPNGPRPFNARLLCRIEIILLNGEAKLRVLPMDVTCLKN